MGRKFRVTSRMGAGVEASVAMDNRDLLVELIDGQKRLIEQNDRIIEQNDAAAYWLSVTAKNSNASARN